MIPTYFLFTIWERFLSTEYFAILYSLFPVVSGYLKFNVLLSAIQILDNVDVQLNKESLREDDVNRKKYESKWEADDERKLIACS